MTKINREEYEVLKGLDGRWKWIARDDENQIYSGEVYVFERKPEREDGYWNNISNGEYAFLRGWDASFQFIQWEDEEAHNIQELIEEYEYKTGTFDWATALRRAFHGKSEETEVKDKKWLQDSITRVMQDLFSTPEPNYFDFEKANKRMRGLIDQLDEPELPVIPKFVAEWYESEGKRSSWWNWFYKWGRDESRTELEAKTIRWMQDYNEERFVDMFRRGYEVEREQKHYVLDTEDIPMLVRTHGVVNRANTHLSIHEKGRNTEHYQLTEQEIKDYDERFWPFAVKVEELEE